MNYSVFMLLNLTKNTLSFYRKVKIHTCRHRKFSQFKADLRVFHSRSSVRFIHSFHKLIHKRPYSKRDLEHVPCEFLYIFVEKRRYRSVFPHLWKSPVGIGVKSSCYFAQKTSTCYVQDSVKREIFSLYACHISSFAEALSEVSANLPFKYSKQPDTAIIAPLSPQSERGGTVNLTPFLLHISSSAARK